MRLSFPERLKLKVAAIVVMAVVDVHTLLIRPWHAGWGATDDEIAESLPGDALVSQPKISSTHALTIQGSVAEVWPWLVQMGQGRAGFYSYEWIENLKGLNIHNSDQILPEFQDLKVGESMPLAPDGGGVPIAFLDPNRTLVLGGRVYEQSKGPLALEDFFRILPGFIVKSPGAYYEASWGFFLRPVDAHTTILIERFRMDWTPNALGNNFYYHCILEPGRLVMERKMLLGIKKRVEAAAGSRREQQ